jgi:hypothetical protein
MTIDLGKEVEKGFQLVCGWATRWGEEVMENSPFQG